MLGSQDPINTYGTSLALELLPYWTDGRIGSMEGLYFESSAHDVVPLPDRERAGRAPVEPGARPRVRDRSKTSTAASSTCRCSASATTWRGRRKRRRRPTRNPICALVATIPDRDGADPKGWKVYEVAGSELVQGLDVRTGRRADARGHDVGVLRPAARRPTARAIRSSARGSARRRGWFTNDELLDTAVGRRRVPTSGRASTAADLADAPRTRLDPVEVTDIDEGRRRDLVPRRRGRRAGRGEGVVLPELGGARRRGSVPPRAEPDGRDPDARTT